MDTVRAAAIDGAAARLVDTVEPSPRMRNLRLSELSGLGRLRRPSHRAYAPRGLRGGCCVWSAGWSVPSSGPLRGEGPYATPREITREEMTEVHRSFAIAAAAPLPLASTA